MKIDKDITNAKLFEIIGHNINWANPGQTHFFRTTLEQYIRVRYVSPKQRSVLFKIAAKLNYKCQRGNDFKVHMFELFNKLHGFNKQEGPKDEN